MSLTLPERYADTIAYMTRFRSEKEDGERTIFVFSNNSPDKPAAPLSAADVFETLKPELRLGEGSPIQIAHRSYQGIKLMQPEAKPEGGELPIGLDSILLDLDKPENTQKVGGRFFRQLLEDLDVVTRFSGPKFARVLLHIAHIYLVNDVDAHLDQKAGSVQIDQLLEKNPMVADAVLRVLQVPEADVPRAKKALETALEEGADIEAITDAGRNAIRNQFVKSLMRLRNEILVGGNIDDKTIAKIFGDKAGTGWFWNFSKHNETFDLGDMCTRPPGASLPELYQHYMHHVENVHSFIRAPMLHSFVFMWLMGKYKNYVEEKKGPIAKEAFKRGVLGAADRIYGESDNDRARRKNEAVSEGETKIENFKPYKLNDDVSPTEQDSELNELKKRMGQRLIDEMTKVFDPVVTFHRQELQKLLETWFLDATASTSGPLKQVLDDSRAFVSKYKNIYTRLLRILNRPENFEKAETIMNMVTDLDTIGDYKEVLHVVADRAHIILSKGGESKPTDPAANDEAAAVYRREVSQKILDEFSKQVGRTSIQHFSDKFDEKAGEIKTQVQILTQFYRTDRKINDGLQKVSNVAAGAVVPSAVASAAVASDLGTKSVKSLVSKVAQGPPTKVDFPNSNPIQAEFTKKDPPDTIKGKLEVGGSPVGSVEMRRDGTTVEIDAPAEFEKVKPDQGVTLTVEGKGFENMTFDKVDPEGAIRSFVSDVAHDRPLSEEEIVMQIEKLPSHYGELRERIRALYCKNDADLGQDAFDDFQKAMRALSLGEILQAAPDAESRLGAADVSQTVRLMLDLVRNVGDLRNNRQANPFPDETTLIALGPDPETPDGGPKARLNLSTYFPVPDEDGGDSIQHAMDYHETICKSIGEVKNQLADINDLKALAKVLPYNAKLVVVNNTLSGYMGELGEELGEENFLPQYHHPSVILFGRCAGVGSAEWTDLKRHFKDLATTTKEELSCPMVVSHNEDQLKGCPFPVAELKRLSKIGFLTARPSISMESGDPLPPDDTLDALTVENAKALLSIPAAMAVAPMLQDTALGKFPDKAIKIKLRKAVQEYTGVTFQPGNKGELVVEFLRRCWRESKTNTMLEALVIARLATLALNCDARSELKKYKDFHAKYIVAKAEEGDHPALTGAGDLLGIKSPLLRFHFTYEDKMDMLLEESEGYLFKDNKENHDIRLEMNVKKALRDSMPIIPKEMLSPLSFIGF